MTPRNHIMHPNPTTSKPQPTYEQKTLQQVPFASEEGRRMFREALLATLPSSLGHICNAFIPIGFRLRTYLADNWYGLGPTAGRLKGRLQTSL